ncbi:hypothetical protein FI667_g14239, partial [Globisporangium splendens]
MALKIIQAASGGRYLERVHRTKSRPLRDVVERRVQHRQLAVALQCIELRDAVLGHIQHSQHWKLGQCIHRQEVVPRHIDALEALQSLDPVQRHDLLMGEHSVLTHLVHVLEAADVLHLDDAVLRKAERVLVVVTALRLSRDVVRDLRETRDTLAREIEAVHSCGSLAMPIVYVFVTKLLLRFSTVKLLALPVMKPVCRCLCGTPRTSETNILKKKIRQSVSITKGQDERTAYDLDARTATTTDGV